jgi:hypothetical protein
MLGARLIVGWQSLLPPVERPEALLPVTVEVRGVVEGTPRQVFERFSGPSCGGITSGSQSLWRLDDSFRADVTYPEEHRDLDEEPPSERARWIGNLELVGYLLELKRFSFLRFKLGFQERFVNSRTDGGQRRVVDGHPHPLPVGSTEVRITFSKHPHGGLVSVVHDGIPSWLHDDVAAFWTMVLERNKPMRKWKAAMPWDDYENDD